MSPLQLFEKFEEFKPRGNRIGRFGGRLSTTASMLSFLSGNAPTVVSRPRFSTERFRCCVSFTSGWGAFDDERLQLKRHSGRDCRDEFCKEFTKTARATSWRLSSGRFQLFPAVLGPFVFLCQLSQPFKSFLRCGHSPTGLPTFAVAAGQQIKSLAVVRF